MKVRVFRTSEEAARAAAAAVAEQLARKPSSVLGLPTGRTSLGVYQELVRLHGNGAADFSQAHTFNIDEFLGVKSIDARSYHAFMQEHLFGRVNLLQAHIHFLNGCAKDPDVECERFEREIAELGGMDVLLLGIGANAHIGFNEPGRSLHARAHRARLAAVTRKANAALLGVRLDKIAREALTMGVGTMLEARRIVLIATGRSKAKAVKSMVLGKISTLAPASLLQFHPNVEVMLDSAAAEKLPKARLDA